VCVRKMNKLVEKIPQRQFWLEAEVLDKLYYKNKNQHRTTSHFQKLVEVCPSTPIEETLHAELKTCPSSGAFSSVMAAGAEICHPIEEAAA